MTLSNDEIEQQFGNISRLTFQVVIGLFFGLSVASVIARMAFRVNTHRSLYIDDYILLAGLLCLCPATAILYKYCDTLFLGSALLRNPSLLLKLDPGRIKELLQVTSYFYAFMALIWTTIFTVKFSFLAFFKKLIERVTKIHTYYWIVVVITVLTWPFMVVAPFIVCRHFVDDPLSCYDDATREQLKQSIAGLIIGLDVLTDILIVSIPIIILRRAKIKTQQKFALGFFLCLSLVMAIIAIVRVSKIRDTRGDDVVWSGFWLTMEGCVAVLMTSITAFRTAFTSRGTRDSGKKRWAPSHSWVRRARLRKQSEDDDILERGQLPSIPRALLTGVRTYIQEHHRTAESNTWTGSDAWTMNEEDSTQ